MDKVRILFLGSNPVNTSRLRIDAEYRAIANAIRSSEFRDRFELYTELAVRVEDMARALLESKPDIIHISGHGNPDGGLLLEDHSGLASLVSPAGFSRLLASFGDNVRLVFLAAGFSQSLVEELAQHAAYVVGFSGSMTDSVMSAFASTFYRALASGQSIEHSYAVASHHLEFEQDSNFEVMFHKGATDLGELSLIRSATADRDVEPAQAPPSRPLLLKLAEAIRSFLQRPKAALASRRGNRFLVIHAEENRDSYDQLCNAFAPLIRRGEVQLVSVLDLLPQERSREIADNVAEKLGDRFVNLVYLLTPALLDTPFAEALSDLLAAARERSIAVHAVLVEACSWETTPFAMLPILPASHLTVDEGPGGWSNIVPQLWSDGIRRTKSSGSRPRGSDPARVDTRAKKYRPRDVFTTIGQPSHTLVETEAIRKLAEKLWNPGLVLVVEGPSGIGKTVGVRHVLTSRKTLARNGDDMWHDDYRHYNVRTKADLTALRQVIQGEVTSLRGHHVIDDFHRLPEEQKREIGDFGKALADSDNRQAKITLIGINHTKESLVAEIGDLATRCECYSLRSQPTTTIVDMIERGEKALNIRLRHRNAFAVAAEGSLVTAQILCGKAVQLARIPETVERTMEVQVAPEEVIPQVLDFLKQQFHRSLQQFGLLDSAIGSLQRGGPLALLFRLSRSSECSLMMNDIRPGYPMLQESFDATRKALESEHRAQEPADWRSLLYCNPYNEQLAFDDPKLLFYLKRLGWMAFARDCGIEMRFSEDHDNIVFPRAKPPSKVVMTKKPANSVADAARAIRILHISDFHFRESTKWDAHTVLGRLSTDVAEFAERDLAPDLLVITGDIAYSGQEKEYQLAKKWFREELLPSAKLDEGRLFVVPGNHDVDRGAVDWAAQQLQEGITGQKEVAAALESEGVRLLLRRHECYVAFVDSLQMAGQSWTQPWGSATYELHGLKAHVAGFSSAWLSGQDGEQGRLALGLWQCERVFRGADDADLVIAAMHHPWEWFAEWDEAARNEVQRSAGLVLRGHLHESKSVFQVSPDFGGHLHLAAGSAYAGSTWPNSYQLIEADPFAGRARIFIRYWDKTAREWRADLNRFQGESGELPLRKTKSDS